MAAEAIRAHQSSQSAPSDQLGKLSPNAGERSILDPSQWIRRGQEIIAGEIAALKELESTLDNRFSAAVNALLDCHGKVVTTGIGKAGLIAQKFSASLSSTGTPSHFLHPSEAVHGDLGCLAPADSVVIFSYSGETEEVIRLLSLIAGGTSSVTTLAITRDASSTLGRSCDLVVPLGRHSEACSLGLAPSTSTTLMLALSDAMTLVLSDAKAFTREQFGLYHPGGSLGKQLQKVTEVMRPPMECRIALDALSIREVFVQMSRPGRRSGAIMLVDEVGRLSGIFTDSDLARILEQQRDAMLDRPVSELMTRNFRTIHEAAFLPEAVETMAKYKISELPVVDGDGRPCGMIDITDVVMDSQGTGTTGKIKNVRVEISRKQESTQLRIHNADRDPQEEREES